MRAIRGNLLIVEDDHDIADLCSKALLGAGYGVRWVQNRDAAVVTLNMYLYQIILLDFAMPGMSIEEFLPHCKSRSERLILMSAVVDPGQEAARLGVKHWLKKPFDPTDLIEMIRSMSSGTNPKMPAVAP